MIKKIILSLLFILTVGSAALLYLVKTLDVNELDLYYSVKKDDLLIYSSVGDLVGEYSCVSDNCFLAYSSSESTLDNIIFTDESKKSIEITIPVMGSYSFIFDDNTYNLVDLETEQIISSYRGLKYLENNFIVLKDDSNMQALAYYDETGVTMISDFSYNYIGQSDYSDKFLVMDSDGYYLINSLGNKVSFIYDDVFNYSNEEVVVKTNGYYYLYDYSGNLIFEDGFTMIKLDNDFIYLIVNNLLSVYDKNYNLLNSDTINLGVVVNWKSYYIYNDDYKFLYESSVFTKTYEDEILTIYANDNEYNIEIN